MPGFHNCVNSELNYLGQQVNGNCKPVSAYAPARGFLDLETSVVVWLSFWTWDVQVGTAGMAEGSCILEKEQSDNKKSLVFALSSPSANSVDLFPWNWCLGQAFLYDCVAHTTIHKLEWGPVQRCQPKVVGKTSRILRPDRGEKEPASNLGLF